MKTKTIRKSYFSIIICMLCYINVCNAQIIPYCDTCIGRSANIFYVVKVKNSADLTTRDLVLQTTLIKHIDMPSKEEFKKTYGDIKADLIMIITPKQGVKFLTLSQIFDRYKVDKEYRNYLVIVDRTETEDSKTLLANEGIIEKVVINKEKKYVEIITIGYKANMHIRKRTHDAKIESINKIDSIRNLHHKTE